MPKPKLSKVKRDAIKKANRRRLIALDPPRVLCVDPGENAGFTLLDFEEGYACRVQTSTVNGDDPSSILSTLGALEPQRMIIEHPFGGRMGPDGLRTLFLRFGHWVTHAQTMGVLLMWIWPAEWQSRIPGYKQAMKRDPLSALYCGYAESCVPEREGFTEDEAASFGIASWYLEERGYNRPTPGDGGRYERTRV